MINFSAAEIELQLYRYPRIAQQNLQAWDAADEYLINQLSAQLATANSYKTMAIINDSFGALACACRVLLPDTNLVVETDAKTSQLGTIQNFEINQLNPHKVAFINSRDDWQLTPTFVLMKLPKNKDYFIEQLCRLSKILPVNTQVWIGTKAKQIDKNLLALIGRYLGEATASLAWKKTRVIQVMTDGNPRSLPQEKSWTIPEYNLQMSNFSNVFAAKKLDIGARIMLANLPQGDFHHVLDLGCGNGVLALRAAQLYPNAHIHCIDDSEMAIACAQANWINNGFALTKGNFYWDDCLTELPTDVKPDLILCNPPFHQGEALTDHIAWQMFNDAHRKLINKGILQIVGNRHLGYHVKLKRIFGNCKQIASNGKFVVLQAIK